MTTTTRQNPVDLPADLHLEADPEQQGSTATKDTPPFAVAPFRHPAPQAPIDSTAAVLDLDVVIPVYNEAKCLRTSILRLTNSLSELPLRVVVTIADNASTDTTLAQALELASEIPQVRVRSLPQKGRGRALRDAWLNSEATVVAYMDVDLSTSLDALYPLVAPLLSGHSDLAIGSRLSRSSHVERGPTREFISRSYNLLLRTSLGVHYSDAQCGFKAIRSDRARELIPLVQDEEWFFDTELLTIAERAGLRIHEVPVDWIDDPDSRVNIAATAWADLRGVTRLLVGFTRGRIPLDTLRRPDTAGTDASLWRELVRFALIGVVSTLVFAVLYVAFRSVLGSQAANVAALLLATVANTAANRRFTFGFRGRPGAIRNQFQGFVVLGIALAITSSSLLLLNAVSADPSHTAELLVLTAANLVATVVRFLLFRSWVFNRKGYQS